MYYFKSMFFLAIRVVEPTLIVHLARERETPQKPPADGNKLAHVTIPSSKRPTKAPLHICAVGPPLLLIYTTGWWELPTTYGFERLAEVHQHRGVLKF